MHRKTILAPLTVALASGQALPVAAEAVPAASREPARHDFPYPSRYVTVDGVRMHYVEAGEGRPILLLHGNPTWSYLWRRVIPELEEHGRVIALDWVGFGKSDKPAIDYALSEHAAYLRGFVAALGLEDVNLVVHDWGSFLGFQYAADHPENVSSIAFMEGVLPTLPGEPEIPEAWRPKLGALWQTFEELGAPEAQAAMLEDNAFIERLLPLAIDRELTEDEWNAYREPFPTPASRRPIVAFRQAVGSPAVAEAVERYSAWLAESPIPKLMVAVTPGVIGNELQVRWVKENLPNVSVVSVGEGLHFVQEDHPRAIGRAIADWLGR